MKNYKLFIIYCLCLNFSNCHSDMKKSWLSTKSTKNQLTPNLEPDLPKFTPFHNNPEEDDDDDESINIDNSSTNKSNKLIEEWNEEDDNVTENIEPFQLNKDDESFIDKFLPFSDYVYDMYDTFKNSKNKKHKKIYKNKKHAEKIQDQNHDDDIGNEFATEKITTVVQEKDESATTMINLNQNETIFSANSAADDNVIYIDEEHVTESSDMNSKQYNKNNKYLQYNVGPGVNVSLDVPNEIVRVQLDENCLKDVFTGRGKKKTLITKTLALFILPFLIQTSFVPFLLTTIKLMLGNSIIVGKIAILLFLIALFKNYKLNSNVSETMPYYLDTSQSHHLHYRRSEMDNKGYVAVGKPETYIT